MEKNYEIRIKVQGGFFPQVPDRIYRINTFDSSFLVKYVTVEEDWFVFRSMTKYNYSNLITIEKDANRWIEITEYLTEYLNEE